MINLGFNSGRKMPRVYLEPAPIDRILEGVSVLLTAAAWVLAIVFYYDSPVPTHRLFISPEVMTVLTLLLLWASRAPIRFYNFPVKLNERNYMMQYFIATRFVRVVNVLANIMVCWGVLIEAAPQMGADPRIFYLLMHISVGILLVSFVVYYIFAFRNK